MNDMSVALENVRSLYNIGAIFRTSAFFGIKDVYLIGYSAKRINQKGQVVLHQEVKKTSLGAENNLNLHFLENSAQFLAEMRVAKKNLVCAEQSLKAVDLASWQPKEYSVVVFGNEVDGVSPELMDAADEIVQIPSAGSHNSLNITTACGIVLAKAYCL